MSKVIKEGTDIENIVLQKFNEKFPGYNHDEDGFYLEGDESV